MSAPTSRLARRQAPDDPGVAGLRSALELLLVRFKSTSTGVRFTGSLALGVAGRAITLLGDDAGSLAGELAAARATLVRASANDVPAARAAGSELAMRAATALTVTTEVGPC